MIGDKKFTDKELKEIIEQSSENVRASMMLSGHKISDRQWKQIKYASELLKDII